jgi:NAD(P)-dependent dehydrogenase (short-subunit alcohol dehydrogenase family)
MTKTLEGQRALVVGASSGIGRASALRLLLDGARVTLCGRTGSSLQETAEALIEQTGAHGTRVECVVCDATRSADVQRAVAHAGGEAGLDIAVTIPGGGNYAPVLGYDDEAFMAEIDQNLRPTYLVLKYAGLSMTRSGGGSIVCISSTAAIMSSPFLAAYCAAKAGVDQLVRVAADELGMHRIRVNAVRPGLTRTAATTTLVETDLFERFREQQPLARPGEPEDIAGAVRFLAGPESGWMTGQCVTVDGGHTIRRFPDMRDLARNVYGPQAFDAIQRGEQDDPPASAHGRMPGSESTA